MEGLVEVGSVSDGLEDLEEDLGGSGECLFFAEVSSKEDVDLLKEEAEILKKELEAIQKRLREIEKEKTE